MAMTTRMEKEVARALSDCESVRAIKESDGQRASA
jgi:Uri superfamily endonuclease